VLLKRGLSDRVIAEQVDEFQVTAGGREPFIDGNPLIRTPQREAYNALNEYAAESADDERASRRLRQSRLHYVRPQSSRKRPAARPFRRLSHELPISKLVAYTAAPFPSFHGACR
jgi:hypothetical protein